MIIEIEKVRMFAKHLRSKLEIQADIVFSPTGFSDIGDLHFCCGPYDEALFRHEHLIDIDSFNCYDVRKLYEAFVLLDKRKMPLQNFILKDQCGVEHLDIRALMNKKQEVKLKRICSKPRIIKNGPTQGIIKRR
ncbi:hypothetical protein [Niabella sp.]|uniref:hypothetical protein n=1 Tax=Niabella sp. TaxID=1962976 RepID=UPI002602EBB3|nr:hypothetical protein [Niabella sp.]